jgi:hypothetical protein
VVADVPAAYKVGIPVPRPPRGEFALEFRERKVVLFYISLHISEIGRRESSFPSVVKCEWPREEKLIPVVQYRTEFGETHVVPNHGIVRQIVRFDKDCFRQELSRLIKRARFLNRHPRGPPITWLFCQKTIHHLDPEDRPK